MGAVFLTDTLKSTTIAAFTNSSIYAKLNNVATQESGIIKINDKSVEVSNGAVSTTQSFINGFQSGAQAAAAGITTANNFVNTTVSQAFAKPTAILNSWITPTTLSLTAFEKAGKEIDDLIKGSLVIQAMGIKGTEILCSVFCLLMSMLSCETRNNVYNAIKDINSTMRRANQVATSINEGIKTYNATMTSVQSIANTAAGLFNKKQDISLPAAVATLIAVPSSIAEIANLLSKALTLSSKFSGSFKESLISGIYTLAQQVLFILQAQALALADSALNKVVKPVEDALKRATPQNCIGNMAQMLVLKIIGLIEAIKSTIKGYIADLFISNKDFTLKFDKFNMSCSGSILLLQFTTTLKTITAYFGDIAIACGVQACGPQPPIPGSTASPTYRDKPVPDKNKTVPIIPLSSLNINNTDNVATIAQKLAPVLQLPFGDVVVTQNSIITTYNLPNDPPKTILKLINEGALDEMLKSQDNSYTIYTDNNKKIKVVYKTSRNCGE
jgi:hypothetical protein